MQDRTVANVAVFFDDGIGTGEAVHHAGILKIGSGFEDQAAKVTAQAGAGADIAAGANDHITDQNRAGMHIRRGINHGNNAVNGVNAQGGHAQLAFMNGCCIIELVLNGVILEAAMSDDLDSKHGVQSLEIGMGILRAMMDGQRSMMLKDIAAAADMPASKAHRYLVSLIRAGLVEQDPMSSRYDLGPLALNLGLVALDRLDRVRLGLNVIAEMRDEINQTTALAVWGDRGPVIVRWERPRRPITVNVITGTVLDLLSSATGRVFAAWMPKKAVTPLLAVEMKAPDVPPELKTRAGVETMLAEVRAQGYATTEGFHRVPGVEAVAAPVFNFRNEITMAVLVVGVQGMFDTQAEGAVVRSLKRHAEALSLRLGAHGEPKTPA